MKRYSADYRIIGIVFLLVLVTFLPDALPPWRLDVLTIKTFELVFAILLFGSYWKGTYIILNDHEFVSTNGSNSIGSAIGASAQLTAALKSFSFTPQQAAAYTYASTLAPASKK